MSSMFMNCGVKNLDLSSFNTSNVTNMSFMFTGSTVETIDFSSFDTSNVTNMLNMFAGTQLTILDLSNFSFDSIPNADGVANMLQGAPKLAKIYVPANINSSVAPNLPTAIATNWYGYNSADEVVATAEYTTLPGKNVLSTLSYIQPTGPKIATLKAGRTFNRALSNYVNGTEDNLLATGSANIKHIKFVKDTPDTTGVQLDLDGYVYATFDSATGTVTIKSDAVEIHANADCSGMFENFTNMVSVDLGWFTTENTTTMEDMFYYANSLTSIDVSSFDMTQVTTVARMFDYIGKNTDNYRITLDLSDWHLDSCTSMDAFITGGHVYKIYVPSSSLRASYNNLEGFGGGVYWYSYDTADNYLNSKVINTITMRTSPLDYITRGVELVYDTNGGSTIESTFVEPNSLLVKPENPTKSGNAFEGWYKDNNTFENAWDFATERITTDTTLYAKWESAYTVTFELNGGTEFVSIKPQMVKENGKVTKPSYPPSKSGYSFIGWYTDNGTFLNKWDFDNVVTSDMTLYAKFVPKKTCTITFDSNGGSAIASESEMTGSRIHQPSNPTKSGNAFVGWYTDNGTFLNAWDFDNDIVEDDITLYAKWNAQYTVEFRNGSTLLNRVTVKPSEKLTLPTAPTKSDSERAYDFMGWATTNNTYVSNDKYVASPDFLWDFDDEVTSDMTLYAYFCKPFEITLYDAQKNGSVIDTLTVYYGATPTAPTTPTKAGYEFVAWSTSSSSKSTAYYYDFTAPNSNRYDFELYAIWNELPKQTIQFVDALSGSVIKEVSDVLDGTSIDSLLPTSAEIHSYSPNTSKYEEYWSYDRKTDWADYTTYWYPITYTEYGEGRYYNPNYAIYNDDNVKVYETIDGTTTVTNLYNDINEINTYSAVTESGKTIIYLNFKPQLVGLTVAHKTYTAKTGSWSSTGSSSGDCWPVALYGTKVVFEDGTLDSFIDCYNYTHNEQFSTNFKWYLEAEMLNELDTSNYVFGTDSTTLWYCNTVPAFKVNWHLNGGSADLSNYGFTSDYDDYFVLNNSGSDAPYGETTIAQKYNQYVTSENVSNGVLCPALPIKHNATFEGFYLKDDFTGDRVAESGNYLLLSNLKINDIFPDMATALASADASNIINIDLYAKWDGVTYSVAFNSNGGSIIPGQVIDAEAKVIRPTDPIKSGYVFKGWFTDDATFLNEWDFNNDIVTATTTLYAKWEITKNNVTFNSNGGTTVPSQNIEYGSKATKPTDPTKQGYDFKGWFTDNNTFINEWDFGTNVVTSATELFAKWEIKHFNVTFDSDGGSTVPNQSVDYGNKVTKPTDPTKANYNFQGWYNGDTAWDFDNDTVTEAITLKAKWLKDAYLVTFNSNGGSTVATQTVGHGDKVVKPANPTKSGYTFNGWYTEATCENAWDFNNTITSAKTLYADWKQVVTYTVTFDSNGGSAVASQPIVQGQNATKPSNPTKSGYDFNGWYYNGNKYSFATPITANITLVADWKKKSDNPPTDTPVNPPKSDDPPVTPPTPPVNPPIIPPTPVPPRPTPIIPPFIPSDDDDDDNDDNDDTPVVIEEEIPQIIEIFENAPKLYIHKTVSVTGFTKVDTSDKDSKLEIILHRLGIFNQEALEPKYIRYTKKQDEDNE